MVDIPVFHGNKPDPLQVVAEDILMDVAGRPESVIRSTIEHCSADVLRHMRDLLRDEPGTRVRLFANAQIRAQILPVITKVLAESEGK